MVLPLVALLLLTGCAEPGERPVARERTLIIAHPTGGLNQIVDYDSFNPFVPEVTRTG
jgi:outer membrane biogenesis lipoprotein LolB